MLTVYGIRQCDKVRATLKALEREKVGYQFHDFRKDGLDRDLLNSLCEKASWADLLNKRSTTWRGLPDQLKQSLAESDAKDLMLKYPTLIKRPVVLADERVFVAPAIESLTRLAQG